MDIGKRHPQNTRLLTKGYYENGRGVKNDFPVHWQTSEEKKHKNRRCFHLCFRGGERAIIYRPQTIQQRINMSLAVELQMSKGMKINSFFFFYR